MRDRVAALVTGVPRSIEVSAHVAFVLAVVSGMLYGLAFPPWRAWGIAWIALVPLLLAIRGASFGRVVFYGWAWTMALSLTVIPWFGAGAAAYFGQSPLVGVLLFLLVPTVTGAVEYAAFAVCYRALGSVGPASRTLLAGAAWVMAELGRTKLLFGNPWELLPYSQLDAGSIAQIADTTGVYGVSFVVATANAALAELVLAGRDATGWKPAWRACALALTLAASAEGYGRWRAHLACDADPGVGRHGVAVVQANVDIGTQWRPELYGANLETYLRLTHDALRSAKPRVVFWPENAMTFFVETGTTYIGAIRAVLATTGAELVAGGPKDTGSGRDAFFNSAFLIQPDAGIGGRYDKRYLIPFGERFPLIRNESFLQRFARVQEFAPGEATAPLATAAGSLGVLICNEALFPELARAHVRDGATYLAILANDAWTRSRQYGDTALEYARMRAIEQRWWVVRSSTSGPSAIVDPCGTVTARTEPFTRAVLEGEVAPRAGLTPYARVGDAFAWGCAGVLLAWLVRPRVRHDRSSTG